MPPQTSLAHRWQHGWSRPNATRYIPPTKLDKTKNLHAEVPVGIVVEIAAANGHRDEALEPQCSRAGSALEVRSMPLSGYGRMCALWDAAVQPSP